ncbi:acyltransferase family protein [Sphingobacterium siyangense]|uniref:acyltransferase family protein n=1 Tax=Sphingobacterium siyangense TaxID=459529 RepID=UPI003DA677CC
MGKDYHLKHTGADLLSKTINFLRFPLIVGVVFIHTDFSHIVLAGVKQIDFVNFPIFTSVFFLFSKIIFEVCVPLFYFISGFLFFYRTEGFSIQIYFKKLKDRFRSLFIPYIFWNFVVLLFFFLAQAFFAGSLISGVNKPIVDYSVMDWIWSFWDTSKVNPHLEKTLPANSPFWFIRDLMVVVVFSPLLYWLVKKLGVFVLALLGLLWLYNPYFYLPGISTVSFFFFTAGAYFSIYKKDFVLLMKPLLPWAAGLFVFIVAAEFYFFGERCWSYLYCASVMVGLLFSIALSARFIEKGYWQPNSFLAEGSFFIFAYHRLPLVFVIKFLFYIIRPQSEVSFLLLYIACPAAVITLGLLGYRVLKNMLPRFTAIICGGR